MTSVLLQRVQSLRNVHICMCVIMNFSGIGTIKMKILGLSAEPETGQDEE